MGIISRSHGTAVCYCSHAQSEWARKRMSSETLEPRFRGHLMGNGFIFFF